MNFCILSSGSKANCIYVASSNSRVLIDCGLSAKEAAKRLSSIGIEPESITGILVSHEHSDHIAGIPVFSKRHNIPVYMNRETYTAVSRKIALAVENLRFFETSSAFSLGDLLIEPFSLPHDAADPVGFKVTNNTKSLGIITDLGQVTTLVRQQTRGLDALILESNHDQQMLQDGPYPWSLKQRIASRCGHLSNTCAGRLIEKISLDKNSKIQIVVAAHISEKNNIPSLALDTLQGSWNRKYSPFTPEFVTASATCATKLVSL